MQIPFRVNLSAANFPLHSDFMGQSVVIPQYDQNFQRRKSFSGDDADLDIGVPQMFYCENVLPVGQGLKSVGYTPVLTGASSLTSTDAFTQVFSVSDAAENKALLGITAEGKLFIYTSTLVTWSPVIIIGWTGGLVTVGKASGKTYVCLSFFGIYFVDIAGNTLTSVALNGITTSLIKGITASANYLILYDDTSIYWSSTVNAEDFVPSLVTGAGSGVPTDIRGKIQVCFPISGGFAIYTTTNIITAAYSGNTRYPWQFRGNTNSSGIQNPECVSGEADAGANYAWTYGGLLKVTTQSSTATFPEVTDFLASRQFERYNAITGFLESEYLSQTVRVKLSFVGSRYLVISYGKADNSKNVLTHALVYDTAFKRWGKLAFNHVDVFEVAFDVKGQSASWINAAPGVSWVGTNPKAWNEFSTMSNSAALPKKYFGLVGADGSVNVLNFDYGDTGASGVLVLGKYQLTRNQACSLEEISLETVESTNPNFGVKIWTEVDGKTIVTPAISPVNVYTASKLRKYFNGARRAGKNHCVVISGAFHLVSGEIKVMRCGRI